MNTKNKFYTIKAGSGFGVRAAIYEEVESLLVLREEGESDNLAGNEIVTDFNGLTQEEAGP